MREVIYEVMEFLEAFIQTYYTPFWGGANNGLRLQEATKEHWNGGHKPGHPSRGG